MDDPRTTGDHRRRLPAAGRKRAVTLVGVVHDHPASKYRVRAVVDTERPDVLALELPPLALPLFLEYASDDREPPAFGGEMSAAIQAAETERIAGIDGPSVSFARKLLGTLVRGQHPEASLPGVARRFAAVTKHALTCRVAATLARKTGCTVQVDRPTPHDTDWTDDPAVQASDEQRQIRTARTVMNAFQGPGARAVQKTARERHMADRLETLRKEGAVVAVVGIGHLDALAERLDP